MSIYGKELILDLHHCNVFKFTRSSIKAFFSELCDLLDMKRERLYWWDDQGVPAKEQETESHMKGTTAVQFIRTSNITIHTLDLLGNIYLNIFSCKDFDADVVENFSQEWFQGNVVARSLLDRQ